MIKKLSLTLSVLYNFMESLTMRRVRSNCFNILKWAKHKINRTKMAKKTARLNSPSESIDNQMHKVLD